MLGITHQEPSEAQLCWSKLRQKHPIFMHKLALIILSALLGCFVAQFILSFFLNNDEIPLE